MGNISVNTEYSTIKIVMNGVSGKIVCKPVYMGGDFCKL